MHMMLKEAQTLAAELKGLDASTGVEVLVCPPFTALSTVGEQLTGTRIALGAQDMAWEAKGAFTGAISPTMLKDVGCTYVIIGHSERRSLFGESNAMISDKLKAAQANDLIPILCIGETLEEREAKDTFGVLERQLDGALANAAPSACQKLIIAYEPVWAIGTGRNATAQQAQEAHAYIRNWLSEHCGRQLSEQLRIQYGGSVTAQNAAELLQQPDVDGALVGGASLKADSFVAIVQTAQQLKGERCTC